VLVTTDLQAANDCHASIQYQRVRHMVLKIYAVLCRLGPNSTWPVTSRLFSCGKMHRLDSVSWRDVTEFGLYGTLVCWASCNS